MRVIASTNFRAIENYESKKEKWLLQVATDSELSAGALRVAIAIGLHMNRKQRLLAWPGFGRLQKLLDIDRSTVIRGVKALEGRGHMRIVRSRNGSKNHPNHYHPNIWRTGVVAAVPLGRCTDATRVVAAVPPEPMNEPMKEPPIRRISTRFKNGLGGRGSEGKEERRDNPYLIAQPNLTALPTSEIVPREGGGLGLTDLIAQAVDLAAAPLAQEGVTEA
jgi:hypothetical protein